MELIHIQHEPGSQLQLGPPYTCTICMLTAHQNENQKTAQRCYTEPCNRPIAITFTRVRIKLSLVPISFFLSPLLWHAFSIAESRLFEGQNNANRIHFTASYLTLETSSNDNFFCGTRPHHNAFGRYSPSLGLKHLFSSNI